MDIEVEEEEELPDYVISFSHSLRTVSLECPLLISLPTEEEIQAVLSRSDDCARWGLGQVGT